MVEKEEDEGADVTANCRNSKSRIEIGPTLPTLTASCHSKGFTRQQFCKQVAWLYLNIRHTRLFLGGLVVSGRSAVAFRIVSI